MKKFYSTRGNGILIFFIFFLAVKAPAQTTLVAGDIAFTGYISSTTDQFSFVLLRNVSAGTAINFTDDAWTGAAFRGAEETVTWTSSSALAAGTEILVTGLTATRAGAGGSGGSVTGTVGGLNFTTSGDQVLAYQGPAGAPTFISGLHMNMYSLDAAECGNTTDATWDPVCIAANGSSCILPPGLISGTNAMWIGTAGLNSSDRDDARYNCSAGLIGTIAQVRASVNDKTKWLSSSLPAVPPFPLPANCNFAGAGPLPIHLVTFIGKINTDKTATLQWKMDAEEGVDHYILEKSADGVAFTELGLAFPGGINEGLYSINDPSLNNGINYYRVRIEKGNGAYIYSAIVALSLRSNLSITIFPNPVKDMVTIQQMGSFRNTTAQLLDSRGYLVSKIQITGPSYKLNMNTLSKGIYFLKTDDGSTFKLIKQ